MFKGVGKKLRQLFAETLGHFMEETREWIQERIGNAFIFFLETLEKHQIEMTSELIDEIEETEDIPPVVRKLLKEAKSGKHSAASVILGTVGASATGTVTSGVIGTMLGPTVNKLRAKLPSTLLTPAECFVGLHRNVLNEDYLREQLQQTGYNDRQIDIILAILKPMLTPDELARLVVRQVITQKEYTDLLKQQGFSSEQAEQILSLYRSLLGVAECRDLLLRGEISEEEHDQRLRQIGFRDDDIGHLKKLYFYIPSPSDLVRMAVREAWTDETAEMFGYDEEFPEEFAEWAEKQGMSRDWAKRFWRAHWEIPSPTMGYEMLHRGIITEKELDTLLKTADYPTFWREKMMRLSYSPYTRVDVRRMYQLGILTKEDVKKAYKDLGYVEEHAENLTQFTISYASTTERDITKSEILRGYRYKLLSAGETIEALMKIGYDEEEAEYYISLEDYQQKKEEKEDLLKRTKTEFTRGIIDRNEVVKRLSGANFQADEIEYHLKTWDVSRETKPRQPSLADLKNMFKARIITEATFKEELANLGYSDRYIDWYVKLVNMAMIGSE